jgi:hypothetical protein
MSRPFLGIFWAIPASRNKILEIGGVFGWLNRARKSNSAPKIYESFKFSQFLP